MQRVTDLIYTCLFCAAIGLVPLCTWLGLWTVTTAQMQVLENRPISMLRPIGLSPGALKEFTGSLEPYARDRLPLRKQLLTAYTATRRIAGAAMTEDAVVIGTDGWLFFGNQHARGIDQYRGLRQLDADGIANAVAYFSSIRQELAKRGIPFIVAIAPDKHSIYPEYLPSHLSRPGTSPTDQLMAQDPSGGLFLDLRRTLRDAKQRTQLILYCKNDSHWNQFGAYLAYREIMRHLPVQEPLDIADTGFVRATTPYGDIVPMVGVGWNGASETAGLAGDPLRGPLTLRRFSDGWVQSPTPSPMTRVTDHRGFTVTNPRRSGTVLVLGDSFADGISMYFNHTFGTTVYQHYRHFGDATVARLADEFSPQAVVFVIAARLLVDDTANFIPPRSTSPSEEVVVPPDAMLAASDLVRGIGRIRTEQGYACLEALDHDPYFHVPPVAAMPAGATVVVDITLPGERMVQLYYQTIQRPQFCEEQSLKAALPGGRHRIELAIGDQLNGKFRLDPGNGPGEYRLHRLSFRPQ
jgi:hypothetical protein